MLISFSEKDKDHDKNTTLSFRYTVTDEFSSFFWGKNMQCAPVTIFPNNSNILTAQDGTILFCDTMGPRDSMDVVHLTYKITYEYTGNVRL